MNQTNALGLKVASITGGIMLLLFGAYWGVRLAFFTSPTAENEQVAQQTAEPIIDSDGDGLPDSYEALYKTDPQKSDTDGDSVSDRDELAAGSDPTIAGEAGISKPLTGQQVAGAQTYTQQYLATLPTDAAREDILDQTRLEAFVATNRGTLLPSLPPDTVITTTEEGSAAIAKYLDTVSSFHNKQLHQVSNETIEAAFTAQLQGNAEPLNTIVTQLDSNIKVLKTVPAPAEVADMHEKLIKATTALHTNVMALRDIDQDFVGGLIATKNIDELGTIFQELSRSTVELETKYGLE